jgi:hypothetical protein
MSGMAITIPGASFANFVDSAIPHLDKAIGYYLFGTDFASSKHNYAPNAVVDLTENGTATMVYGPGYVAMDSVNDYFDNGLTLTKDQTILVATQMPTNTEGLFTPSAGTGLTMRGAGVGSWRVDGSFGGTSNASHPIGVDYLLLGGTTSGISGQTVKGYSSTGGVVSELVSGGTMAADLTVATTMRIGMSQAPAGGTGYRMAAAYLADSQLTLAEIIDIFNYWRFILPKRGAISMA